MGCTSSTPSPSVNETTRSPSDSKPNHTPPQDKRNDGGKPKRATRKPNNRPDPPSGGLNNSGTKMLGIKSTPGGAIRRASDSERFDLEDDTSQRTPLDLVRMLTADRPIDASDVTDLKSAKRDIARLRKIASDFLENAEGGVEQTEHSGLGKSVKDHHVEPRMAMYDKQDFASFKKISYDKGSDVRKLIYDSIKPNVLFENDTREEILEIIDAFKPVRYKKGDFVIKQGDDGDEFYVVETGSLSIHVTVKAPGEADSQVRIGDYGPGAAFGELALIFGSPRAADIKATSDCKLWSLDRKAYRSVISQLRYEGHREKNAFLRSCVISKKKFTDLFDGQQIEDLTIATKVDSYEDGNVILREGEVGETFYILKSGKIEISRGSHVEKSLKQGEVFGTSSLLTASASQWTYRAVGPTQVYYLTKVDFEMILGDVKETLDGNTVAQGLGRNTRAFHKEESRRTMKTTMDHRERVELELEDLEHFNVLGRGAFGLVTLVQCRKSKKVFALKAQSKEYIALKRQKEHVLNEYRIMKEFTGYPTILGIHCAMQDSKYLYFLLDLLPGGELMPYLVKHARQGKGFTEDIVRFYAASVVLAFEQLHACMIAYRDLKPENIVLTKEGYGVVVDFGLAKEIDEGQTFTFCGTPDYLAPEIIRGTGHDWSVDYWELGVFLFEMTNGTAPFYATNQARRTRKILKGFEFVRVPSNFSKGLTDIISSLLNSDQSKRLGRTQNGVQGIINHYWFAGFDWEAFKEKQLTAPIQPEIPEDIKTGLGKPRPQNLTEPADSDWNPDLKNVEVW